MGRQNEPAMLHSSIALLQERFKQLQRVKEMREERELLRLFSGVEAIERTSQAQYNASAFLQQDDCIHRRQTPVTYTSQRGLLHGNRLEFQTAEMNAFPILWQRYDRPTNRFSFGSNMGGYGDTDVDTSLHL